MELDKYKELYDLAREATTQAEARFDAIETKAAIYLSALTFLVGAAGVFAKWVADRLLPPAELLDWGLAITAAVIGGCVVCSWFRVFAVFRVDKIKVLPLDVATLDFFRHNTLTNLRFAIARRLAEAWESNRALNDRKLGDLTCAYRLMMVTMLLVVVFCLLYGVRAWLGGAG